MKRSNEPTGYIAIKAETTGEYDECNFIVIHITREWQSGCQHVLSY